MKAWSPDMAEARGSREYDSLNATLCHRMAPLVPLQKDSVSLFLGRDSLLVFL